ncbi:SusC/RagA family TonB-linked outer membrane protein [Parabacteroides pacaensis]|uniref:SusC/RagA family TonB-linked outer membrane protein n=1 Tax=Parabacteroides pacaensis TaxID=2086575 RepID=UPI001F1F12F0|nr:SusC/RagA family TonB-linked outer membrane protein [Parabacteroides pacaensis]
MKITTILFFIIALQYTSTVLAQDHPIIISKSQTLNEILGEIENQTGYLFFYNIEDIKIKDPCSLNSLKKKYNTLFEILNSMKQLYQLDYVIKGRHIILTKASVNLIKEHTSYSTFTGTVKDFNENLLAGASVLVKGSTIGGITDKNGRFILTLPDSLFPVVKVSYLGYQTTEVELNKPNISIYLLENTQMLDEVQIVAYGKQKKVTVTGAISSITTEGLLKSPSGSVANALSGAMTGISSVQISGQPGAEDPEIFVRGTGSLSVDASRPLILVDGVERSFFQMDPNEIENITILKDASSTAVFGVRGANGVVLVTTRRGTKGKPDISVTSSAGLTQALRNVNMVDSYRHALLYTEAQLNDNPSLPASQQIFTPYIIQKFKDKSEPLMFPDIDWNKYMFNKFAWQTQHNINLRGGNNNFRYFISLGYLHQNGIIKKFTEPYNPNYAYSRYNYRINSDIQISKNTLLKCDIAGRISNQRTPIGEDVWRTIMWAVPYGGAGIIDGKFIKNTDRYISIPMTTGLDAYYNQGYNTNTNNVLNVDLSLSQKLDGITKGLYAEIKAAYNSSYNIGKSRSYSGPTFFPVYKSTLLDPGLDIQDPAFDNTIVLQKQGEENEVMGYNHWTGKARDWYAEASIRYERNFEDHNLSALILYNQSKTYYPAQYPEIPLAYVGLVARATYSYKLKYLCDWNIGYNGSENFAPGKRFGLFPAFSLGWVASEEMFIKKLKVIDFLKLRASWGKVGNDKYSGARFLYLMGAWNPANFTTQGNGTYNFGQFSSTMLPDAKELAMGNSQVTWETVQKQNYGIDMNLFDSRISFSADVFFEKRKDILSKRNTLPSITAVNLPLINLGKVNNHGYEISLGWKDKIQQVGYWVKTNLSFARNKIMYMDEVPPNEPYMAQTGRCIGLNYGYIFDRFFLPSDFDQQGNIANHDIPKMAVTPKPGDAIYKDLNHDGKVDSNDKTYFGYSERPEYIAGLLAGFNWKNWEFSMQWTGAWNASRMLQYEYRNAFGTSNNRGLLEYLADGRWTPENSSHARFPRLTFTNKEYNQQTSDLWLMDASYLRLKVAEISYTLAPQKLKKIGVKSIRLFCNGYNLFTLFSDLNDIDIDPEGRTGLKTENTDMYPNIRIYNLGVNIKF